MNKHTYHTESSLGYMSVTTHRLLNSTLRRKFKSAGIDLTPEQWGVMLLLWERESATQDALAQALCVDKSSMSRVLSSMDSMGLIDRTADPNNERKKIVRAKKEAFALREQGFALATDVLEMALGGVSREDAETCIKVLAAVKRNLQGK